MGINRTNKTSLEYNRKVTNMNSNKEKNAKREKANTTKFERSIMENNISQSDLHSIELGYNEPVTMDRWSEKHMGQMMESDIHDRTRWKSSKEKTKNRNNSRRQKMEQNNYFDE